MKIYGLMQAHMSSTRLPGKVMMDVHGAPELYRVLERVRQAKCLDQVIVAISDLPCDDILEEKCREWGVPCYRGSDTDVLARFWGAAQQYPADAYYRLTSDNPLNDPGFIEAMTAHFLKENCRYTGGNGKNPIGVGGEVFTAELLDEAMRESTEPFEHEHVTPYMYRKQPSITRYPYEPDHSKVRITMDTPEDYQVIQKVYDALYAEGNHFTLQDVIRYLEEHPEVAAINKSIVQKADAAAFVVK